AETAPVLVVLDDAQWLDRSSVEALAFAARRLIGEEIAFLVALRAGAATPFESFDRLTLGPLAEDAARKLLASRPAPVSSADETRLLAAAAGNPLALLELPVELARDLPTATTSHDRLLSAFSRRVDELPEQSRLGLLLAAAEADVGAVRRAAAALGLRDALAPAEQAGLVRVGAGEVAFRHPVVRSLVYSSAADGDRRAAHRALADALPDEEDRDRRAWHLAAAVEDTDEEVAAILEQTAQRAAARGGRGAAAVRGVARCRLGRRRFGRARVGRGGAAARGRTPPPRGSDPAAGRDRRLAGPEPARGGLPEGARADRGDRPRAGGADALRGDHAAPEGVRRGRRRRARAAARGGRP